MPVSHMILIALAGVGAGAINAVVGSGTLITFPTLVALGYPPVTATMSMRSVWLPAVYPGRGDIGVSWAGMGPDALADSRVIDRRRNGVVAAAAPA